MIEDLLLVMCFCVEEQASLGVISSKIQASYLLQKQNTRLQL